MVFPGNLLIPESNITILAAGEAPYSLTAVNLDYSK